MQQQVLRRQLQQLQQQVLVHRRQLLWFQQAQLSNKKLIRKSGIFALFYPFILEKRMEKTKNATFFDVFEKKLLKNLVEPKKVRTFALA